MMTLARPLPSQEELKKLFKYNSDTGVLTGTWKGVPIKAQDTAGYVVARVGERMVKAHRIIWVLVTGEDPGELEIDHKNRIKNDNRFQNLRACTRRENSENRGKNITRTKNGGYRVIIKRKGKLLIDRTFREESLAIEARDAILSC